jgi:hypothetical protein
MYQKYKYNNRNILQMVKEYTNLFHSLALQNLTKLVFLVQKYHLATLLDTNHFKYVCTNTPFYFELCT